MNQGPKQTVFFIDRCLGKHPIAEMLAETGITVEIHDDHFDQDTPDLCWLPKIGQWGWIILTKDARIARNTSERQAVARVGVRMFTLASKNLTGEQTAIAFRDALNSMLKFVEKHPAPFIAKVYKDGRVSEWKEATELLDEIS
ncbi:hypothetical protein [Roseofilum casamattae]|uniref:VapC45 PIN like domain-containing protein n=1 Tax=Roseofilum casamattae BLCC-M143 TaxID=3022442 RepID=A0ABT7C104_9CYAN|nr:hypothetical protein [Roseofilum casamattae]MDJ1184371.1 hypothetical protein [Roseofilum casamattae BLCC-M143]